MNTAPDGPRPARAAQAHWRPWRGPPAHGDRGPYAMRNTTLQVWARAKAPMAASQQRVEAAASRAALPSFPWRPVSFDAPASPVVRTRTIGTQTDPLPYACHWEPQGMTPRASLEAMYAALAPVAGSRQPLRWPW